MAPLAREISSTALFLTIDRISYNSKNMIVSKEKPAFPRYGCDAVDTRQLAISSYTLGVSSREHPTFEETHRDNTAQCSSIVFPLPSSFPLSSYQYGRRAAWIILVGVS